MFLKFFFFHWPASSLFQTITYAKPLCIPVIIVSGSTGELHKKPLRKVQLLCIHYCSKPRHKPTKKKLQKHVSPVKQAACQQSVSFKHCKKKKKKKNIKKCYLLVFAMWPSYYLGNLVCYWLLFTGLLDFCTFFEFQACGKLCM